MADKPAFDLQAAHRFFAADCFNRVWELLDKAARTAEDNEEMIRLAIASHWHWTQRPDCTAENLSISYWQIARVYAVLGQADNSRRYAERCLAVSQEPEVAPFFAGYAYEALARAEYVAGDRDLVDRYVREARTLAGQVSDPEERTLLLDDLNDLDERR